MGVLLKKYKKSINVEVLELLWDIFHMVFNKITIQGYSRHVAKLANILANNYNLINTKIFFLGKDA